MNRKIPAVSVVVPAYNSMEYLPETISSLLAQSYTDFEVIIVNDGSTDNTQEWGSQIQDSRVVLISQENRGLSGARNTGICHAKGQYIAFLDADDLWHPSKLKKQVQELDNNASAGLVYSWVSYIDDQGRSTGKCLRNSETGMIWDTLIQHNIVECGSVAMVRRECFDQCGLFDEALKSAVEDWDMWLRIAAQYPFAVVKEALTYYRQHPGGASKDWKSMERSYQVVIEKAFSTAPAAVQSLKDESCGYANLKLAWKPLQAKEKDCKQAIEYQKRAAHLYPPLKYTKEYARLSIAIFLMRTLGPTLYRNVLDTVRSIKGWMVGTS
ncbi:glycosyltransferase family 2 protein [Acaryochloris thomasi]|uniref:glycosyltransferase family 2 protein n=1 Tax=Acaryochloris thomasi TaxID=2929456 RepID=UPI0018F23BEE|nr:glycosyltransferase family A protein [Acaryochloris thomasi]